MYDDTALSSLRAELKSGFKVVLLWDVHLHITCIL